MFELTRIDRDTLKTAPPASVLERFAKQVESIGWEPKAIEISDTGRIKIEIKRGSLRVYLTRDELNRVSISRERWFEENEPVGRRGDRFIAKKLRTEFLGRQSCAGIRDGMRTLAHYIADNSGLQRIEVKNIFRPLLANN